MQNTAFNKIGFSFLSLGGSKSAVSMEIPKIKGVFTGSGDVFSALILAWMAKTEGDLKVQCIFHFYFMCLKSFLKDKFSKQMHTFAYVIFFALLSLEAECFAELYKEQSDYQKYSA